MKPQTKILVPESARKDKGHKHEWELCWDELDVEVLCKHCPAVLQEEQIEQRLNVLEDMLTWKDGIYTGTQMRDFARIVCDPASIGS